MALDPPSGSSSAHVGLPVSLRTSRSANDGARAGQHALALHFGCSGDISEAWPGKCSAHGPGVLRWSNFRGGDPASVPCAPAWVNSIKDTPGHPRGTVLA